MQDALSADQHNQGADTPRKRVLQQLHRDLDRLVRSHLPRFDTAQRYRTLLREYRALLADAELLTELGSELFNPQELAMLAQPPSNADAGSSRDAPDYCDVPCLHYLHLLVYSTDVPKYDHIVIDEAQDVSELELLTMSRFYSRAGSFTILGDLPQSIHSYRGDEPWSHVRAIFPQDKHSYRERSESYRMTFEIAVFAGRVLDVMRRDNPNTPHIRPFQRHGPPPVLQQIRSDAELIVEIGRAVAQAKGNACENIAIITKTTTRVTALAAKLMQDSQSVPVQAIAGPDVDYQGGVVVLPVHLAKGMEFDAAIIVDADDHTYTTSPLDSRLLYVALTRALHELYLFWQGQPSSYFAAIARRGREPQQLSLLAV